MSNTHTVMSHTHTVMSHTSTWPVLLLHTSGMHASRHTHEWVMSHTLIWPVLTPQAIHVSCHMHELVISNTCTITEHTLTWPVLPLQTSGHALLMSHASMSHVTRMKSHVTHLNMARFTTAHLGPRRRCPVALCKSYLSHGTHVKGSCHTRE